jgi:DivIVA domain-containing protein
MATTELEASSIRAGDIAGQRFELAKRGYEPDEVHRFLQAVADHLGHLQGEIEWQRARVEHLEQRSAAAQDSAYDRISREFMEVVRRADEAATQVRARAEGEARAALISAHEEANRILAAAAEEAERVLLQARREAEQLVADATRQVERLVHDAGSRTAPMVQPDMVWYRDATPEAWASESSARNASEAAFAEFEDLNLQLDGSLFDLFGETGP